MTVYVMVSKDRYELPLIVADTQVELARRAGVRANSIATLLNKHKRGLVKKTRYLCVEIDDEKEPVESGRRTTKRKL